MINNIIKKNMFSYLLVLMALALLTLIIQRFNKIKLYKNWSSLIKTNLTLLFVGSVWDTWAIWQGHWTFSTEKTLGLKIGLMPLEEYLFILIVPYFIITIYKLYSEK